MATRSLKTLFEKLKGSEAELLAAVGSLEDEKLRRVPRKSTPRMILFEPEKEEGSSVVPPGSVTIFLAPAGSPFLADVVAAFSPADRGRIKALRKTITDSVLSRQEIALTDSARELTAKRTYADVSYGSTSLARNLGLPNGIPFGTLAFPYNGGDLDAGEFELVEHTAPGIDERLEAVLIRRPPPMTAAEREALAKVPPDLLEVNIGAANPQLASTPTALITVAVFVTINAAVFAFGQYLTEPLEAFKIELAEKRIQELGPLATARQLLALRHRLMFEII